MSLGWILVFCSFLLEDVWFLNDSILTLLLCSLLQASMFGGFGTNFDQDLNGWDVSSGINFVSFFLILVHCLFLLEDVRF